MDILDRIKIEHECTVLSHAFGYHLDQRDYNSVASLFDDDGVWIRYGVNLRGREALIEALNRRPASLLTRHVVVNVFFTEVEDSVARAVVTILAFFNDNASEVPAVLPAGSVAVMDFHDTYVRTANGWRISERDTYPVLAPESLLASISGGN